MLQRSDDPRPVIRPVGRGALDGAVKPGGALPVEFADSDEVLRLLAEEQENPPVRYERTPDSSPAQPGIAPNPRLPQWEELTETDAGYLLRHEGRLYAAIEIDAEYIVSQAFNNGPTIRPGVEVKEATK